MLMSVAEDAVAGSKQMPIYPELAGKRVLITGVSGQTGADVASAFADHKARMIVNFAEQSAAMQALAELIAPAAMDLSVFHDDLATTPGITRFARTAAGIHDGFDVVINFMHLGAEALGPAMDEDAVERLVSEKLLAPCLISKIAANRMALTWSEGVVINIMTMAPAPSAAHMAIAKITRASLAAMTRRQAGDWADQAVRINAIAPDVLGDSAAHLPVMAQDAGIAALALCLASKRGGKLSGQVFDASGVADERC